MDPPIRPVPTTNARGRAVPSVREVIAEHLGTVEIHVVDLVFGMRRIDMQQHADAQRHGAGYGDLGRAEQRYGAKADLANGGGREDAGDVAGGREEDADDVLFA